MHWFTHNFSGDWLGLIKISCPTMKKKSFQKSHENFAVHCNFELRSVSMMPDDKLHQCVNGAVRAHMTVISHHHAACAAHTAGIITESSRRETTPVLLCCCCLSISVSWGWDMSGMLPECKWIWPQVSVSPWMCFRADKFLFFILNEKQLTQWHSWSNQSDLWASGQIKTFF